MKQISEFAVLFALLGLVACGGSGAPDNSRPGNQSGRGQATTNKPAGAEGVVAAKPADDHSDILRLSAVRFSPKQINAAVDISAEADVAPPVPEGVEFEYRWFVNTKELAGATTSTLKSGNFRKRQWVYCQVRAMADGKTSEWLDSIMVRVANAQPQIEAVAVDQFPVPGKFSYQIKASDADNDELTYGLISPLDAGIVLDKKSGLLTWEIDNQTIEKLGETIVISFSVSDNDAKPTTGALTLNFQKSEAKNQ